MLTRVSSWRIQLTSRLYLLDVLIILTSVISANCLSVDHCYSDIGCFPLSDEFYHPRHRPFNVRPWHRSRIKIKFELYNRRHPNGFMIQPWNERNLQASGFNPMLETKVIVPGWLDNIKRAVWIKNLCSAFLWNWDPVNIIVMHWRNFTPYTIATANTRVVGAELANMLRSIEQLTSYDRSYFHLIGHSLGAHISGYAGDRLPGLGRITALDPARPFFQHMPKSVRLDRSDARFVDAIHSDFTPENAILLLMSYGMTTPVGHLDFYPNGPPLLQAGCLRDSILSAQRGVSMGLEHSSLAIAMLEALRYLTACDHQRAHEWFIESIMNRQCLFVGVRCDQYEGLINGRCTCDGSSSACAIMGIHADQMYLNKVHEDSWPLNLKSQVPSAASGSRPMRPPPVKIHPLIEHLFEHQHSQQLNKDQIYSHMKHQAQQMRRPPEPMALNLQHLLAGMDEEFRFLSGQLDIFRDFEFLEYLRANMLAQSSQLEWHEQQQHQQQQPQSTLVKRQDLNPNDDLGLSQLLSGTGQPQLMSSLDSDIERWYEDTSRWFLKTNNKPNYCVNQYQLLIFLGPLDSSSGRERLRANLLISIIGSRGQLMNQRFVPRSQQLDSFTMQPFFILLEGSYSLGNILSVAIGWEARLDPDPIQASVSFKSNLLEGLQSFWPTYNARHPWLSQTLKYDHSGAFQWLPPALPLGAPLDQLMAPLARRTGDSSRIKRQDSTDSLPGEQDEESEDLEIATSGGCSIKEQVGSGDDKCAARSLLDNLLLDQASQINQVNILSLKNVPFVDTPDAFTASLGQQQTIHPIQTQPNIIPAHLSNLVNQDEQLFTSESGVHLTAKLHNMDFLVPSEDTIVINQVVISPVQAHYGKTADGFKLAKVFCPPHGNFKLRRDQTVRLSSSLKGKCSPMGHYQSPRYTHKHHPIRRPQPGPVILAS